MSPTSSVKFGARPTFCSVTLIPIDALLLARMCRVSQENQDPLNETKVSTSESYAACITYPWLSMSALMRGACSVHVPAPLLDLLLGELAPQRHQQHVSVRLQFAVLQLHDRLLSGDGMIGRPVQRRFA